MIARSSVSLFCIDAPQALTCFDEAGVRTGSSLVKFQSVKINDLSNSSLTLRLAMRQSNALDESLLSIKHPSMVRIPWDENNFRSRSVSKIIFNKHNLSCVVVSVLAQHSRWQCCRIVYNCSNLNPRLAAVYISRFSSGRPSVEMEEAAVLLDVPVFSGRGLVSMRPM